jgi:hypothetical protein
VQGPFLSAGTFLDLVNRPPRIQRFFWSSEHRCWCQPYPVSTARPFRNRWRRWKRRGPETDQSIHQTVTYSPRPRGYFSDPGCRSYV